VALIVEIVAVGAAHEGVGGGRGWQPQDTRHYAENHEKPKQPDTRPFVHSPSPLEIQPEENIEVSSDKKQASGDREAGKGP
jgi:hypothetical protein